MTRLFLFIFISSVCLFTACKKESTTTSGMIMTAQVNNKAWKSTNTQATLDKSDGLRLIVTADSSGSRITLSIKNYSGKGEYIISDSGTTASYTDAAGVFSKATSGKITVDTLLTNGTNTNTFKGQFDFLAGAVGANKGFYSANLYLN